ncbi:hypothetical protein BABINDRAFT_162429 [Babjeviella inositovora NRRL Y-12698]|uniref:1-phosphatidylinositol-3-phosphate 5-kinase n=1 Tax=Babjeviella inositovora NRRL Y-12698 TaxID=984486 RepID=A0A1E3QM12_9ASCO|nr:uncharacterized protein BABINDRAFT_162429 [Babjeviella inositovora NRRL Y-12698]ODQ78739.1 hypothetical protein BABINDRAFT_162429 [Babjeviella inositovora NRRL Y-12698]
MSEDANATSPAPPAYTSFPLLPEAGEAPKPLSTLLKSTLQKVTAASTAVQNALTSTEPPLPAASEALSPVHSAVSHESDMFRTKLSPETYEQPFPEAYEPLFSSPGQATSQDRSLNAERLNPEKLNLEGIHIPERDHNPDGTHSPSHDLDASSLTPSRSLRIQTDSNKLLFTEVQPLVQPRITAVNVTTDLQPEDVRLLTPDFEPSSLQLISQIFKKLPNDIELSDDSDSDGASIANSSAFSIMGKSVAASANTKEPQSRNPLKEGGIGRKHWMQDEFATHCLNCKKVFRTFRRKHHCRFCGQIFCGQCTIFIANKNAENGKMRVCKPCYNDVIIYLSDDSDEEPEVKINSGTDDRRRRRDTDSNFLSTLRLDRQRTPSTADMKSNGSGEHVFVPAPTPPPQMAIPTTRKGESVEIPVSRSSKNLASSVSSYKKRHPRFQSEVFKYWEAPEMRPQNTGGSFKGTSLESSFLASSKHPKHPGLFPGSSSSEEEEVSDELSGSEDEQVMTLYLSLNVPRADSSMLFARDDFDDGKGYTIRSHERAHASLLRMKSRRKSKSVSQAQPIDNGIFTASAFTGPKWDTSASPMKSTPIRWEGMGPKREAPSPMKSDFSPIKGDATNQRDLNTTTPKREFFLYASQRDFVPGARLKSVSSIALNRTTDGETDSPHVRFTPTVDDALSDTFDAHLSQLMLQCLGDGHLDEQVWVDSLAPLMNRVGDIDVGDTLDIKQYVKVKRVLGNTPQSSEAIDGVAITKNVDLKAMPSKLTNPKIALVMFPIEYTKNTDQFVTLGMISSQAAVYVNNIVQRLVSLKPDVILCGSAVNLYAAEAFCKAGIAVVSHVKPQVIERLSRYSRASILYSLNDLFFKFCTLGACRLFEVRRFVFRGTVKTYLFIQGCGYEAGFTMVLRGGDEALLEKVKYTCDSMIMAYFNRKFEKSLLLNQSLGFEPNLPLESTPVPDAIDGTLPGFFEDYIVSFRQRLLSISPGIKFPLPPILVSAKEAEKALLSFEALLKTIESLREVSLEAVQLLGLDIDTQLLPNKEQDLLKIYKFVCGFRLRLLRDEFSWRSRIWTSCMNNPAYQLLPFCHKNITLLYSMVSTRNATPCKGPSTLNINYYTHHDSSLGQFIDQTVAEAGKLCDECGNPYIEHFKSFVHNTGKVDIVLERLMNNSTDHERLDTRVMWSFCKQCHLATPMVNMMPETYRYSFGKYLELSFYSEGVRLSNSTCTHDFYRDHIRYFGFNALVVRMEFSAVETLEVVIPKKQLEWKPELDIALKIEALKQVEVRTKRFFSSIMSRLNRLKLVDRVEEGISIIAKLKDKAREQLLQIEVETRELYNGTLPTVHLPLNSIIRSVQELSVEWDADFNDFEREFLPSENDITRITQFHLKNYLFDKYIDFKKEDELERKEKTENTDGLEEKAEGLEIERQETGRKEGVTHTRDVEQEQKTQGIAMPVIALPDSVATSDEAQISLMNTQKVLKGVPEKSTEVPPVEQPTEQDSLTEPASKPARLTSVLQKAIEIEAALDTHKSDVSDTPKSSFTFNVSPSVFTSPAKSVLKPSLISKPIRSPMRSGHSMEGGYFDAVFNIPTVPRLQSTDLEMQLRKGLKRSNASVAAYRDEATTPSNKVSDLANFFDKMHLNQLSMEFELQRENERRKLKKYRAIPILSSKPRVEVYKKIEDAVVGEVDLVLNNEEGQAGKRAKPNELVRFEGLRTPNLGSERFDSKPIKELAIGMRSRANSFGANEAESIENASEKKQIEPGSLEEFGPHSHAIETTEKVSLLKTLTNFWADRSATLWEPLDYPMASSEHTFADSEVIVREDEPSSLIAFCLSTADYKQKIQRMKEDNPDRATLAKEVNVSSAASVAMSTSTIGKPVVTGPPPAATAATFKADVTSTDHSANQAARANANLRDTTAKKEVQFAKLEKRFKVSSDHDETEIEKVMAKKTAAHLKYQFVDGQSILSCKIFYSEQFEAFREACGCDVNFVQSLSRCVKWDSSGGKSGSSFLKTLDDRFIIKELSKSELESFVAIAPYYFKYMSQSMFNTLTTAIAKIFGFYQIYIKNPITNKNFKMDFLIMENVFYDKKPTRIFDLKGSMRNRHVEQTGKENEVLLDENMVEYIYESPVFVKEHAKRLLRGSLFNDTSFLSSMDVMDYSLVVGIDSVHKKLYVGIIDCIRTFTWDKKVENWVKGTNLMGGKKGIDPTIVTPKQYRVRFREAMERYILEVPDCWYEGGIQAREE